MTSWDKNQYSLISFSENQNWLLVELEDTLRKEVIWVGNVYGPTLFGLKEVFWNSLEKLGEARRNSSCIIARDFNVAISVEDRRGGSK